MLLDINRIENWPHNKNETATKFYKHQPGTHSDQNSNCGCIDHRGANHDQIVDIRFFVRNDQGKVCQTSYVLC